MMSSPAGAQLEWDGRHDVMKCAHIMSQALADPAELINSYNASLHPDEHSRLAIELLTVSYVHVHVLCVPLRHVQCRTSL